MNFFSPVDQSFYMQPTLLLAKSLIGKHLVHILDGEYLVGQITETEAYLGVLDPACHSFGRKKTKRTKVLYGEPGRIYTYSMHTHCLLNIVCEEPGQPEAVLIRAIEPIAGIKKMEKLRGMQLKNKQFSNGPGKLTKAMGITMDYYGLSLLDESLYIAEGSIEPPVLATKRVGIGGARQAKHYPWRFINSATPFVSIYRS
ncbi:DNA-3-methyladenine glycosylase [Bacillus sp. JCM 19041]|uniref:DNA-3-methyladenine glycosylase n=1 Tax=Bacillus sp. JCM 19041 TaxID=1460637 RepID=UPI0006D10C8E